MYYIDKHKSKRWFIKELFDIEKHIGGRIDFIDFYAHTKGRFNSIRKTSSK